MRTMREVRRGRRLRYSFFLVGLVTSALVAVPAAQACPVCFGEAGTGAARGLQAAIVVLGGTTLLAFAAIAAVVVRIRARSALNGNSTEPPA